MLEDGHVTERVRYDLSVFLGDIIIVDRDLNFSLSLRSQKGELQKAICNRNHTIS